MNDSLLSQPEATEAKMAKRRYVVKLTSNERKQLAELIRKGKSSAKHQLKARILLQADESPAGPKWSDTQISEALGTYPVMCARVRLADVLSRACLHSRGPQAASNAARRNRIHFRRDA